MKVSFLHSANKLDDRSVAELSENIDIRSLRAYRVDVGRQTRLIVKTLKAVDFKQKVDPSRVEKVLIEGAVTSEAMEIVH
jgi:cobalamin biosynthesis protein CobT